MTVTGRYLNGLNVCHWAIDSNRLHTNSVSRIQLILEHLLLFFVQYEAACLNKRSFRTGSNLLLPSRMRTYAVSRVRVTYSITTYHDGN